MSWFNRKPSPSEAERRELLKSERAREFKLKEEGIVVEESSLHDAGIDVESMTRTGIHKAWDRFASKMKTNKH